MANPAEEFSLFYSISPLRKPSAEILVFSLLACCLHYFGAEADPEIAEESEAARLKAGATLSASSA
jgi:hypothetical protein